MIKVFCDACEKEIPDDVMRSEMAVSWSVPINTQNRTMEYEICHNCARKLARILEPKGESLEKLQGDQL